MSKAAFGALGKKLVNQPDYCLNSGIEGSSHFEMKNFLMKNTYLTLLFFFVIKDLYVTRCLIKMGIHPGHSVDDFQRAIFNPYNFFFYNFTLTKVNLVCCSNDSFVSAHYMSSEDMLRLDLTIKTMNDLYLKGKIPKPTYEDILSRYNLFGKFLNISEPTEKRHHQ
jgi:hypothetical protein